MSRSAETRQRRVRLALVGPGRWGRILVESVVGVSSSVTFTHAVARSPAKVTEWCKEHGIALSRDLQPLLSNPDVDGFVLATPHSQHETQILMLAGARKDHFCEKPVALTYQGARTVVETITKAGVIFAPGHNRRFLPAVSRMKAMIDSGKLGRILHVEGNMSSHVGFGEVYSSDMWRVAPGESPAGGLAAAGIHIIDLMIHLLGPIASVIAQSDRLVHEIEHDDITTMMFRFQKRATGSLATMTATAQNFRLQVFGEKGWLELRGENDLTWCPVEGNRKTWHHQPVSMERLQLEAFATAIQTRAVYPVPLSEVVNGCAVFEAVVASLESGRWQLIADLDA
ncbi:MAG: Gfo/Idh/MocA family protein [Granulosicoccus sp.]